MAKRKTGIRNLDYTVAQISKKLDIALEITARKLTFDAWRKLTDRTPVDTGRARSSWIVTVGKPYAGAPPPPGTYQPPSDPDLSEIDGTEEIFVTSNIHYMQFLEEGSSQQAPRGMVKIVVAELAAELDTILAQLDEESDP